MTDESVFHQLEFLLVFYPRMLPYKRGTGPYLPLGNAQAEGSDEGEGEFSPRELEIVLRWKTH